MLLWPHVGGPEADSLNKASVAPTGLNLSLVHVDGKEGHPRTIQQIELGRIGGQAGYQSRRHFQGTLRRHFEVL